MIWKKIKKIKYKHFDSCLKDFKKNYVLSHWIYDVAKQFKKYSFDQYKTYEIHKVSVKSLGFKKPTQLRKIYKALKMRGYKLIDPPVAIYLRCLYKNQPKGEWLRIAVPFNSMVDSDGVPHLPKLGSALGKLFIETYWSYPKAIFHTHNNFLVQKNDLSANKNK
tara:strand:+ start:2874 stop:3365 length:492 start_codon:yes stop_codon:yes gene_type:complete